MNIFDRTSFKCMVKGHAFKHYDPESCQNIKLQNETEEGAPVRERCSRCAHVIIKGQNGIRHSEESKIGMSILRQHRERRWAELDKRRCVAEGELERARAGLLKSKAELLADMEMLNADPSRIFNRHLSVKKHRRGLEIEQKNNDISYKDQAELVAHLTAAAIRRGGNK